MKFTLKQFNERYPTSDACLEEIKQLRYAGYKCPRCERVEMLTKIKGRPQYACPCGLQVAPLAGTIFHKSSTDLRTWFFAMFLMTQTRAGISAKQLERMTGVTYKTAWRMFKQIRQLMTDDGDMLTGVVEIDEAFIGGKITGSTGQRAAQAKGIVIGMVERGGRARVQHIPNMRGGSLLGPVRDNVSKDAQVFTDKNKTYNALKYMGYEYDYVNHTVEKVRGNVHTNTVDGYWSLFKMGVLAVYKHVDKKYLQDYANEYAWRYSNSRSKVPMFEILLNNSIIVQ